MRSDLCCRNSSSALLAGAELSCSQSCSELPVWQNASNLRRKKHLDIYCSPEHQFDLCEWMGELFWEWGTARTY